MDDKKEKQQKKMISKAYGKYVKQFTPSPNYVKNGVRAFLVGGLICTAALWFQNRLQEGGMKQEDAGAFVTIGLIVTAQLLTGFGVFDSIAKFAGAGVIVPITGFANSVVSPAVEFKAEGLVTGMAAKMFIIAGPVIVYGSVAAMVYGLIFWISTAT